MRIPQSLEIKGKKWTVEYKWNLRDEDGKAMDGLCLTKEKKIQIDRSLSKEDKWDTFLHELTHAQLFEAHLDLPLEVEEIICEANVDLLKTHFNLRWKRKTK